VPEGITVGAELLTAWRDGLTVGPLLEFGAPVALEPDAPELLATVWRVLGRPVGWFESEPPPTGLLADTLLPGGMIELTGGITELAGGITELRTGGTLTGGVGRVIMVLLPVAGGRFD
jgi:hypothetical protein